MILELQHRRPDGDIDTYHLKPGRRYHLGRGSGCEVRILDLKLSRKHAAIEFMDQAWTLIDLCSTNGCRLNGETMVGTAPLVTGSTIEIGQTALMIGQLISALGSSAPVLTQSPVLVAETIAATTPPASTNAETTYPSDEFNPASTKALSALHPTPIALVPTERKTESETLRPAPAPVFEITEDRSSVVSKTPPVPSESAPLAGRRSPDRARDAIKPVTISPVVVRPPAAEPVAEKSVAEKPVAEKPVAAKPVAAEPAVFELDATVSTLPMPMKSTPPPFVQPKNPTPLPNAPQIFPAAIPALVQAFAVPVQATAVPVPATALPPATGAGNVANSDERSYFITVLSRRIGPLSRAVARDLKARELKGTLRPGDLNPYPQA